jgi:hypothetical protein
MFIVLVLRNTSGLLLLLGLDFSAMIFSVVRIGAIAVSFVVTPFYYIIFSCLLIRFSIMDLGLF